MIPLEQIGASLPPGSEDPRLIFKKLKKIKKFKSIIKVHQSHRQTDGQMQSIAR